MEKREKTMIQELVELESGLNDRELQFVEDMSHKPDDYKLSSAQLKWLEDLWNKKILKAFNR